MTRSLGKPTCLAIHHRPGSFSDHWIAWCEQQGVPYRIVSAYATDLIKRVADCDGFLWHWSHRSPTDHLLARQVTLALETAGIPVFPNTASAWHYDDKLGQKYLLEACDIPHVPTYVFYEEEVARAWLATARFPLVFKLRCGAGSTNVRLIANHREALRVLSRAFGGGFPGFSSRAIVREAQWRLRRDRRMRDLMSLGLLATRYVMGWRHHLEKDLPRQRGYLYVQEFIPGNQFDDRLLVIGPRCFAVRRAVRRDDFRASGSGIGAFEHHVFPRETVALAFNVARKLNLQCVALDILYRSGTPLVAEISYAFGLEGLVARCKGFFDESHSWQPRVAPMPCYMIEDFVSEITAERAAGSPCRDSRRVTPAPA